MFPVASILGSVSLQTWTRTLAYLAVAATAAFVTRACTVGSYKAQIERERAEHAAELAAIDRARADAESKARQLEIVWAEAAERASKELRDAYAIIERSAPEIEKLRRDRDILRDGLRNALHAYAAGRSAEDSVAACRSRAGALASLLADGTELLAEGAGLLEQVAVAHDRRAAEVSALLRAWPQINK